MRMCDAHCDTMMKIDMGEKFDFSFEEAASCGGFLQIFACFTEDGEKDAYFAAVRKIKNFTDFLKTKENCFLAYTPCAAKKITDSGGLAAVLSLENCACLGDEPENLYKFYNLGVRVITLTWNEANSFASGCHEKGGLTKRGKELLKIAGKLGILVDVSHLNEQGFYEVLSEGGCKIFASHSSCAALENNSRNLTDLQILKIYSRGGIVCACPNPPFLNGKNEAEKSDFARHLRHILKLTDGMGAGIGSDCDGTAFCCNGLKTTGDYIGFSKFLKEKDFENYEIQNVFSCNFERFFNIFDKK